MSPIINILGKGLIVVALARMAYGLHMTSEYSSYFLGNLAGNVVLGLFGLLLIWYSKRPRKV